MSNWGIIMATLAACFMSCATVRSTIFGRTVPNIPVGTDISFLRAVDANEVGGIRMMRFSPLDVVFGADRDLFTVSRCISSYTLLEYYIMYPQWPTLFGGFPVQNIPLWWQCTEFKDPVTCYFNDADENAGTCISDYDGSRPFGFWRVICISPQTGSYDGTAVYAGSCRLYYSTEDEYGLIVNGTIFPDPLPPPDSGHDPVATSAQVMVYQSTAAETASSSELFVSSGLLLALCIACIYLAW